MKQSWRCSRAISGAGDQIGVSYMQLTPSWSISLAHVETPWGCYWLPKCMQKSGVQAHVHRLIQELTDQGWKDSNVFVLPGFEPWYPIWSLALLEFLNIGPEVTPEHPKQTNTQTKSRNNGQRIRPTTLKQRERWQCHPAPTQKPPPQEKLICPAEVILLCSLGCAI